MPIAFGYIVKLHTKSILRLVNIFAIKEKPITKTKGNKLVNQVKHIIIFPLAFEKHEKEEKGTVMPLIF